MSATNADAQNATPITLDVPHTVDTPHQGHGQVQELKNWGQGRPEAEQNAAWYRLEVPQNVSEAAQLTLTITPREADDDYDFLLYRVEGDDLSALTDGEAVPVRANATGTMAGTDGLTGLDCQTGVQAVELAAGDEAFSQAQPVAPGETYLLLVDCAEANHHGYDLLFSVCETGPGEQLTLRETTSDEAGKWGTSAAEETATDEARADDATEGTTTFEEKQPAAAPPVAVTRRPGTTRKTLYRNYAPREGERSHEVKPGQTLFSVAGEYGMSVADLKRRNRIQGESIYAGQRLRVLDTAPKSGAVAAKQSPRNEAPKKATNAKAATQTAVAATATSAKSKGSTPGTTDSDVTAGFIAGDIGGRVTAPKPAANSTPNVAKAASAPSKTSSNTSARSAAPKASTPGTRTSTTAAAKDINAPKGRSAPEEVVAPEAQYYLKVETYSANGSKKVASDVTVLDRENQHVVGVIKTHSTDSVRESAVQSGNFRMLFDAFGYLPDDFELLLNPDAKADTLAPDGELSLDADTLVVKKYLHRLRKGDIDVMYNVFFHNEAAILHLKSKHELGQLLDMLSENPNMRVRIHGHTNGNGLGTIIGRGEDKENFFYLNADVVRSSGTSRKLSQDRAEIIRDYLVAEGIDESRIEAEGWGGKRPLYGPRTSLAHKNARVEVEVIAD
ncbi:MAG: OmpA family protein [Catalinimonas sp.]